MPPLKDSDSQEFSPSTRAWWASVWKSPAATQWEEADKYLLYELAELKEDFLHARRNAALAAEIRQRSDALGLTPKGRMALRWKIVPDDEVARWGPRVRDSADGVVGPGGVLKSARERFPVRDNGDGRPLPIDPADADPYGPLREVK